VVGAQPFGGSGLSGTEPNRGSDYLHAWRLAELLPAFWP
jgi:delta 1-pyrroline-5-carboxylate dehydrogenase